MSCFCQLKYVGVALLGICLIQCGCQTGPIGPDGKFAWNQKQRQAAESAQETDQEQQVHQLNRDNESLHSQLALARQQYRVTANELELIKAQLQQATQKLANQPPPDNAENRIATDSGTLPVVDIPGVIVGRDGNTIRIETPAPSVFSPGGTTISTAGQTLLDRISNAISTNYNKQLIAIEGHAYQGAGSSEHHLLASQQSLSIYHYLQTHRLLPNNQFIITSRGSSKPRYSTASEQGRIANQRVEFIIYPEQY